MKIAELLAQDERKDLLRFVTAGSVDDGKSTLIGRLLLEAKGIYEDQLDAIRKASSRKAAGSSELDLSFVTDGLKAEREQGITIDVAYRYFATPRRKFIIADTPGHEQYTRNMATGASTAQVAVILVDVARGLTTQSRRHAFIASLLGIEHLVITINKMDQVGYSRQVFERIRDEFESFAARLEAVDVVYIPISALAGDNVVRRSRHMPWYQGSTLLNHLETVHVAGDRNLIDLRLPVQYVSRTADGTRTYMGTLASGIVRPGDELRVMPAGTRCRVRTVSGPDGELAEAFAPMAVGVTLTEQVDVSRGNMFVHEHNLPRVGTSLDAMLVWMSAQPMQPGRSVLLKHTTNTIGATVTALRYRVDVDTLHRCAADGLNINEIGRVGLTLAQPIAYDAYRKNRDTGPFVLIDRVTNETVAAGMIVDREPGAVTDSAPPAEPDAITQTLAELEAQVRGSASPADREHLLAGDFSEIVPSARAEGAIEHFRATLLAPDVALVTYRVGEARCSSIWKRTDGQWRRAFHQETL